MRVTDWLDCLGSQTATLKCDNEPAILAPAQEIRREGSTTIFEHPEEGEKQRNHLAEGSVNIVKGLIRTLKSSTETNLRTEIGPSHPLIPWIIENAAQLKNRYMVGADGITPTERLRGRGVQRPVYELGEKVLLSPLAPARRGDFGARSDNGIYLGCRSFDGQVYIGTPSGVIRCRTVQQLSAQERWDTEFVLSIKGTPWSPDGERAGDAGIRVNLPEAGGELSPGECAQRDVREVARDRERIRRARHEGRARDMRIEDPDQRLDREVIEGSGASSSRVGAGNEQEVTAKTVAMSEPQLLPAGSSASAGRS